jgi:hypothetical protein
MHVINKDDDLLEHLYTSHDRFLEDIDEYIDENYIYTASNEDSIAMLDLVCGHLLYWYYQTYQENSQAKLLYDDLFAKNEILNRIISSGGSTPESVIYEFNGISIYDELNDNNIIRKESYESIEIELEHYGRLFLTIEEFEDIGGEVNLPDEDDEDDEAYFELSCRGDVFFFMKKEDEIAMAQYLEESINALNSIYSNVGLPTVEVR